MVDLQPKRLGLVAVKRLDVVQRLLDGRQIARQRNQSLLVEVGYRVVVRRAHRITILALAYRSTNQKSPFSTSLTVRSPTKQITYQSR